MKNRREFIKTAAATAGILSSTSARAAESLAPASSTAGGGREDRRYWLNVVAKLAEPVLGHLSRRELRKAMPVETFGDPDNLRKYTHLEAMGRLL